MNENPECKMCEKHADTIERLQARIAELEDQLKHDNSYYFEHDKREE